MKMEECKRKSVILLGEYHKREAQVKLLQVEINALEQLIPSISAVSYDQINTFNNKISSSVEREVLKLDQQLEQLRELKQQIILLEMQNQKIDIILDNIAEPYGSLLKMKYIELLPWAKVYQYCTGYSKEYVKKELNLKALTMFTSLYYPETNQIGIFSKINQKNKNI